MKSDTAYNHQVRLLTRLKGIYSAAKSYRLTSSEINAKIKDGIYGDSAWNRLPSHCRNYIVGYKDCLADNLYRYELVWKLRLKDGTLIDSHQPEGFDYSTLHPDGGKYVWKVDETKVFF